MSFWCSVGKDEGECGVRIDDVLIEMRSVWTVGMSLVREADRD